MVMILIWGGRHMPPPLQLVNHHMAPPIDAGRTHAPTVTTVNAETAADHMDTEKTPHAPTVTTVNAESDATPHAPMHWTRKRGAGDLRY